MRRSLLYQLGPDEAVVFDRVVEEVCLADELGLESVWCLPEAGDAGDFRGGAPEFALAGLAARTKRIRLGWGLAGLTPPEHPPIRTAEQSASLDLASNGRLEIAFVPDSNSDSDLDAEPNARAGASAEPPPSAPWDEGIRMLVDMWDGPKFSWTSPRFEVPPVDVVPKPVQRPHPPLWAVGWTLAHAHRAGAAGLGFLDASGGVDDALAMHRDRYRSARSETDPEDLVCTEAYAAVVGAGAASEITERLDAWERLGFDQAVLRIDAREDETMATRGRIRLMAGESGEVH